MNPLTNMKNLQKLNERELSLGLTGTKTSWHSLYEQSAWIFVGGLPYDLTEGDIISVFSQYGEIMNINHVRDKKTGKPKGYCFICYEDQRSTILAVDNFNGIKILGRTIRVDHVQNYRIPKEFGDEDEITKQVKNEGCGPGVNLKKREKSPSGKDSDYYKKSKNEVKKEECSFSEDHTTTTRHDTNTDHHRAKVKEEKVDPGYDKYQRNLQEELNLKEKNRNQQEQKQDREYIKRSEVRKMEEILSDEETEHSRRNYMRYSNKEELRNHSDHSGRNTHSTSSKRWHERRGEEREKEDSDDELIGSAAEGRKHYMVDRRGDSRELCVDRRADSRGLCADRVTGRIQRECSLENSSRRDRRTSEEQHHRRCSPSRSGSEQGKSKKQRKEIRSNYRQR